MATPIKVITVTHTGTNLDADSIPQQYTITMELEKYAIWSPVAASLGYTVILVSDSTYDNPVNPVNPSGGAYDGGALTAQTLTSDVPKNFSSSGLSTVLGWSFKDSDGNFIEFKHDSLNANNTTIEVTATDDYTGLTVYYHGKI